MMTAAEKMVATQETVYQAEQEALDYMKKRFANRAMQPNPSFNRTHCGEPKFGL